MQELRLVAVSEDGSYAVLVVPGRSGRFALPIDERLRTVARGQFSRLAQYEIEVESPLRPKEIQDRIRAGETAEDIADTAGLPIDRIRRFEGPVLAEREFRAKEAQRATVRGESGPGPRLGEIVTQRLSEAGANADEVDWDSRKRQDGNWQVQLAYTVAGRMYMAEWVYDPRSKHVTPDDDEAMRLCLNEADWPEPRPAARAAATATVTPIGSRAAAASSHPSHQSHPVDQRPVPDRSAGRAVHPSRPLPAEVVVAAAGQPQVAGQPRTSAAGDSPAVPAARTALAAAGRESRGSAAAADPPEPTAAGPAGRDVGGTGTPDGGSPAQAGPTADDDAPPTAPARPARRASGGRSRRSSVPSWDEIMFGNSRQPD